jgi:hypothetical protein
MSLQVILNRDPQICLPVDFSYARLATEIVTELQAKEPADYAARSTRMSISLRSALKSIGLVNSPSAPFSSALRLVSASP